MKRLLFSTALLWGLAASVAAAATLEWNRNTEADMKEYRVWVCQVKDCTVQRTGNTPFAVVPQTAVGVKPTVVLPANVQGAVAVDAGNTKLEYSGLSVRLPFSTVLPTPPAVPSGLLIKP